MNALKLARPVATLVVLPTAGTPSFVSTPLVAGPSLYGSFVMNNTAVAELTWYQFKLDGTTWLNCLSSLTVGPLSTGSHTMQIRTITTDGSATSAPITFTWTITSAENSVVTASGLRGGRAARCSL